MPIIRITNVELRRRETLAGIEALMLSPDDTSLREKLEKTGRLEQLANCLSRSEISIPSNEAANLIRESLALVPKANLQRDVERRFLHGAAAGYILTRLLCAQADKVEETIEGVKFDLAKKFHKRRLQEKTITRIWPLFRPVAHLWAGYLTSGAAIFPCRSDGLSMFLATAEDYRIAGETLRLKRSNTTALTRGETWKTPANLDLPLIKITWEPQKSDSSKTA